MLSEHNPDAKVAFIPQQDGAKVVISGPDLGWGVSGPHNGTDVRLVISHDGPLIRFLLNGHL